jgi:hypothetical protein
MRISVPRQRLRSSRAEARPYRALYWAYGSNLSLAHMSRRCPQADPIIGLYLSHTRMVFRGVADVTSTPRSDAPGGLWRVTPDCERSLDSYEGVSTRVYLKRYFTVEIDDELEDVLFYQMRTHRGIMPPSEAYLRTVEIGYDDFGLDKSYLDEALSRSWENKEVTPMLRERHDRRGRPRLARPGPPLPFYLTEADLKEAGAI